MSRRKFTYILLLLTAALMSAAFVPPKPGHEGLRGNTTTTQTTKRITITFAGDLMQHMPQVNAARNSDGTYDYSNCFEYIAPAFLESDITIVNLETTLSDNPPYSGYPAFRSPARLAADMKATGIDVALLANNHICDRGCTGIDNTVRALDNAGLMNTGAFADSAAYRSRNPLSIDCNGFRINILNYAEHTNGIPVPKDRIVNIIDTATIARDLAGIEHRENALTFVCLHWGYEYFTRQSLYQDSLAAWLHSKGVDFIIGGHPHAVQPLKIYKDSSGMATGLTAFSLGNFVSNQQQANTDGGMVLRLNITKAGNMPATVVPEVFYAWTHKPMENGVKQYYIVPSYDADTILSEDPGAKQRYHKFVSSARNIIGSDPAIKELMGFAVKQRYAPIATPHIFEGYVYPLRHEADTLLPPNVSAANR